jgi:hypothetical protein
LILRADLRYLHHTAMKLASISVVTVSLLVCLLATGAAAIGCSSPPRGHSTDAGAMPHMDAGPVVPHDTGVIMPPHDTGMVMPPHDSGMVTPHDAGHATGTDGGACSVACTSDSACASACGAVPGGGNRCCDTSTSRCFVSHSACPLPGHDSGGGMSY